jgi:hypothetical protein
MIDGPARHMEGDLGLGELRIHQAPAAPRHPLRNESERFGRTGGEQDLVEGAAVARSDGERGLARIGVARKPAARGQDRGR